MELSAAAFKLEQSVQGKNAEIDRTETRSFIDALRTLLGELSPIIGTRHSESQGAEDLPFLREKLADIRVSCNEYDVNAVNDALMQLKERSWSQSNHVFIQTIADYLLDSAFDEIVNAVDTHLESNRT